MGVRGKGEGTLLEKGFLLPSPGTSRSLLPTFSHSPLTIRPPGLSFGMDDRTRLRPSIFEEENHA